jgi:aromatic-L-amino-acid/L-tryptophan decarboxylase
MIVERGPDGVNGSEPSPLTLDPETMRALGYRAVDALVARWSDLRDAEPWAGAPRADFRSHPLLDSAPPEGSTDPHEVLDDALARVLPLAARVDHPRFLAYIPSAPTWPSVVADFLAAGFNVFQGTWQGGSAPTQVELQVLEWFRGWIGMPEGSSGLFTSGGSAANALAVAAARERARKRAGERAGGVGTAEPFRPSLYLSDQGHNSLVRAARAAGFEPGGIRVLPTGAGLRLDPDAVARAVEADRARGWTPVLVAANAGATNTGIVDPLEALGRRCRDLGIHFHVDAAYGGFAVLDPRGAALLEGMERADSVTLDPHKWLFQPFECGSLLVRDPSLLTDTFRERADYLRDTELGAEEVNMGERGIQLTRSFRALKVWMSVRTFGMARIREAVGRSFDLAQGAEARIRSSPHFEVVTPAALGIVTWSAATEALNRRIREHLAEAGVAFLSSTRIEGRHALRFSFLNPATTPADVEAIVAAAEEVAAAGPGPHGEDAGAAGG